MIDFNLVKDLSINNQPLKQLMVGNVIVWKKKEESSIGENQLKIIYLDDSVEIVDYDSDIWTGGILRNNHNVKRIEVGDSVDKVNLFGLDSLESVYLGNNVSKYAYGNGTNYTGLFTSIEVSQNNPYFYCIDNNILIEKSTESVIDVRESNPNVIIPQGIKSIGSSTQESSGCRNNKTLTTIILPDSITNIVNYGMYSNTNLTTITIYAKIPPTLGGDSFYRNSALTSIYVPAESVNTYKTATNWKNYASKIKPIP